MASGKASHGSIVDIESSCRAIVILLTKIGRVIATLPEEVIHDADLWV
jgi:hypothetical protein